MIIYSHLHDEHVTIKNLMEVIASYGSRDSDKKSAYFEELKTLLQMHAKAEEKAFYDQLKIYPELTDQITHAIQEHELASHLIGELSEPSLKGTMWHKTFLTFKHQVEHHIDEEEATLFKMAKYRVGATIEKSMEESMSNEERKLFA